MTYVYNLANSDLDVEYMFSHEVSPEWAVCYAYADANNLISLLFSTRQNGADLEKYFPLVYGRRSVCCGDYVANRDCN